MATAQELEMQYNQWLADMEKEKARKLRELTEAQNKPEQSAPQVPAAAIPQPALMSTVQPVASRIEALFRKANIDPEASDAKAMIEQFSNQIETACGGDAAKCQQILHVLDEGLKKLNVELPEPVSNPPMPGFTKEQADKPPFMKKDEEKKEEPKDEEKKEDKKEEGKKPEPKKDGPPAPDKGDKAEEKKSEEKKEAPKKEHHDEKPDIDAAKKAIGLLEKVLEKEEKDGESGPHLMGLKEALEKIKEFMGEEKSEMGSPALEMKDPHSEDILKTGPATPLPPGAAKPELGLDKGLHPITDAKPLGPTKPKLPVIEGPKVDLKKELGASKEDELDVEAKKYGPGAKKTIEHKMEKMKGEDKPQEQKLAIAIEEAREKGEKVPPKKAEFEINDRVWQKQAGENYEIGDEPGRIVAIAEGKIVVDWGLDDVPTEEKPEDLVKAVPMDTEGTLFSQPSQEEVEISAGLGAFTPVSHEVQKVLSGLSFADVMAQHIEANPMETGIVTHIGTGKVGKVIREADDGRLVVKFGESTTELWPHEVR